MADSRAMRAGMIEEEIDRFIIEGQYSLAVILSQTMLEELHAFLGHNRLHEIVARHTVAFE